MTRQAETAAWDRIDELKSEVLRLKKTPLKLEMEREEALDEMIASKDRSHALLKSNGELLDTYERMKRLSIGLGVVVAVVLVSLILSVLAQVHVST